MTTTEQARAGRSTRNGPGPDRGLDDVFAYMLPSRNHRSDREMYEWLDAMVAARDERTARRRARLGRAIRSVRTAFSRPGNSPGDLPRASKHRAAGSSIVGRITHHHP